MHYTFHMFLHFFFPPRKSESLVYTLRLSDLEKLIPSQLPHHSQRRLPYQHPSVRALVWELKYHQNPHALALAAEVLREALLDIASELLAAPLLIPLPMHPARKKARGYNQTELLCKATAATLGESVIYTQDALLRTRETTPQQSLSKYQRQTNVAHSMKAEAEIVRSRVCIVVDDVTTTGATLKEAKRALLAAGAAHVIMLALAE